MVMGTQGWPMMVQEQQRWDEEHVGLGGGTESRESLR